MIYYTDVDAAGGGDVDACADIGANAKCDGTTHRHSSTHRHNGFLFT